MKLLKLVLLTVLLNCASVTSGEAATGGTVILAKGAVTATAANQVTRLLAKGAAIDEGDVISTSLKSFAVIRMIDNTKLTLKPGTTIAIGKFNDEEGKEEACINLVKGGLRTVTGLIGKRRPEAFNVDTPIASIGIRGTDFIVRVCAGEECLTDEKNLQQEVGAEQAAERAEVAESINEQLPEGLYGSCETGAITISQCAGQVQDFQMGKCRTVQQTDCMAVVLSAGKAGFAGMPVQIAEPSTNTSRVKRGESSGDVEGGENSEGAEESKGGSSKEVAGKATETSKAAASKATDTPTAVASKATGGSGRVTALAKVPAMLSKDPHFALSNLSDSELAVIDRLPGNVGSQSQCSN